MEKKISNEVYSFMDYFKSQMSIDEKDIKLYTSLELALLGDAIYDLIIRYYVICNKSMTSEKINIIHAKKSFYVRAKSQAAFIDTYIDKLSDKELAVFKRGRNAKSKTTAKNATVIEYRKSTGFEALIGYLFLENDMKRMIDIIISSIEYSRGIHE